MSKTFNASFPVRVNKFTGQKIPAETVTFTEMENGSWMSSDFLAMFDEEVAERCRKATNWPEIKATYFHMYGFNSGLVNDNTGSHKSDL